MIFDQPLDPRLLVDVTIKTRSTILFWQSDSALWQIYSINIIALFLKTCFLNTQEAQLAQRNRALLRAIEYFAKSLNIIENSAI